MTSIINNSIRITSIIALLLTLLLSGCADHRVTRLHVLSPIKGEVDQLKNQFHTKNNVGIREIKLPAYLDRPQIVKRIGDNELFISSSHQWGEPLSESVSRVLTEQLDNELFNANVYSHPWSRKQTISVQVNVIIKQFEIVDDQACVLDVSWLILPKGSKTGRSHHAKITVPAQNQRYSTYVTTHSQALSKLSKKIADSLPVEFQVLHEDL